MLAPVITTRFVGPSNYHGAYIYASCRTYGQGRKGHRHTWQHAYDGETNHAIAAQALANKLGFDGAWHGGDMGNGTDQMVFVRTPRRDADPAFVVGPSGAVRSGAEHHAYGDRGDRQYIPGRQGN